MTLGPVMLDFDSGVPVFQQIKEAILTALARGELAALERLPPIHELARILEVNPNTVARAYRELELSGHLVAERGRGTFASAKQPKVERSAGALEKIVARAVDECERSGFSRADLLALFKKVAVKKGRA